MLNTRALKTGVIGVAVVMGMAGNASAQAQPEAVGQDQVQSRYKIFVMEGVLERAVANGAANLSRQVRAVAPDSLLLTGVPQVRGFRLEGYGVFFDVQVPALRRTLAWTLRTMADSNGVAATTALTQLREHIQQERDPARRSELQRALRRLELQLGPTPRPQARARTAGDVAVSAQSAPEPGGAPAGAVPQIDANILFDPNDAYTREVKAALTDAMLENSGPLAIGADEWLTIAARDNEPGNRLVPGDAYDVSTIVFRVRGADLAAFRSGRLSLDEARKRVDIKEF